MMLLAVISVLSVPVFTAGCRPKPKPIPARADTTCSTSQHDKAGIDDRGRDLKCTYDATRNDWYWLEP
jgi:hypothetical protein